MGLTLRHVLLLFALGAIVCAPLYAHFLPPMAIPFVVWWEAGCIAFAALFAWRVYGSR
jgi:hypothetical protein